MRDTLTGGVGQDPPAIDAAMHARLETLTHIWSSKPTSEAIRTIARDEFPGRVAVASSFGAESAALLALVAAADPSIPVLFLNTGMLFDETIEYAAELTRILGLTDVRWLKPPEDVLEKEDPERALWITDPDRCCNFRKVQPFQEAMKDIECWFSGLKRWHGGNRVGVKTVELEAGRFKVNPLADWTQERVQQFIVERGIPPHPLAKKGYVSIGCVPCTRLLRPGETPRSGRWSRSGKAECGIHEGLFTVEAKQREEKEINRTGMFGRSWMITGVCGTIGQELLKKILQFEPTSIVGVDNNESETFFLYDRHRTNRNVKFYTLDIRDTQEVEQRMGGCEILLHVAAAKHVLLCEEAPSTAIQTNILGTQNMIEMALRSGVERFLFTSSDKAVNPTNVMGSSKLMAERLVSAANAQTRRGKQIFASTRFGNVLGSRGSVIPVFMRQIQNGGPLTVTDPNMTRFIMSKSEAAQLVMDSTFLAQGGEIFVTKMPVVRIGDLAEVMVEEFAGKFGRKPSDIKVEIIGPRAGEKRYEELMNEEEIHRCVELPRYYAVKPAILSNFREIDYVYPAMLAPRDIEQGYNSRDETPMTKEELRKYLLTNPDLFEES